MIRRFVLAMLFVSLFIPSLRAAEGDPLTVSKVADIKKLMRVSGTAETAVLFCKQVVNYLMDNTKSLKPDIPEEVFVIAQEELMQLVHRDMWSPNGLMDRMVPIWDKYLSHQEIQELIKVYENPVVKKLVVLTPAMHREGRLAGEKWGEEIGPELVQRLETRLKAEGYPLDSDKTKSGPK